MRSSIDRPIVPFLVRSGIVALLVVIAGGLLSGPAGIGPEPQNVEATAGDFFGWSVVVSGDTAIVGAPAGAAYVFQRDQGGVGAWGEVKRLTASDAQTGDSFGGSVAISGDTAVVGAIFGDPGVGFAGAAYVFQRDEGGADNWGQVKKLTASDAQDGDRFGISVAVSGDTTVVGAYLEDAGSLDSFFDAGAAYVFQRNEGGADNWGEAKKLTASDAQFNDEFGISVAVSGDTAVVGAFAEDAGGSFAGAAYVFQRDEGGSGNWGEVRKLTASDGGGEFGWSVAVSADTIAVGARSEDAGGAGAGAAYVFQRNEGGSGNWGEVTKLTASDAEAGDFFGISVAVSGDTAVVGAWGEDATVPLPAPTPTPMPTPTPPDTLTGAAYVFGRDQGGAGNWGEVRKLTASDAEAGDFFGWSVTVSGDTAVVGAYLEDAGGTDAGAAYVFGRDQGGAGNWGEVKKLLASVGAGPSEEGLEFKGTCNDGLDNDNDGLTDGDDPGCQFAGSITTQSPIITAPNRPNRVVQIDCPVPNPRILVDGPGLAFIANIESVRFLWPSGQSGTATIECYSDKILLVSTQRQVLIDPSGRIYDTATGFLISGATVTLEVYDSNAATFVPMDAVTHSGLFDPELNPQITGVSGRYAWDVADGKYRVQVSTTECGSATSSQVSIPPPVTDLDVGLACPDPDGDGLPTFSEVELGTDPALFDTDGDTVSDANEDPDADGLTNLQELILLTNPLQPDTDGGGVPDGLEVNRGREPIDPSDDAALLPEVGGIAELPEVAGTPLETSGSSGGNAGVLAGMAAALVAVAVALTGAAWYARRRL